MTKNPAHRLIRHTILFCAVVAFLFAQHQWWLSPKFLFEKFRMVGNFDVMKTKEPQRWKQQGDNWQSFTMPFFVWSGSDVVELEMYMNLPVLYPSRYKLIPDDCLQELWVNGQLVEGAAFCNLSGKSFDLGAYLHKGNNHLRVILKDYGGAVFWNMRVDRLAPVFLLLRVAFFVLLGWYGFALLKLCKAKKNVRILFAICLFAGALMKFYDTSVSYSQYAYDYHDHFEYIRYVKEHWRVPPAQSDWQMYQPPAYYFAGATLLALGESIGRPSNLLADDMETFAWALTFLSLIASAWIATMLFPKKSDWAKQYWFLGTMTFLLMFAFFRSRIAHEAIAYSCAIFTLTFFIHWVKKKKPVDWYIALVFLGICLLRFLE